jgi:hypothetical protein
MIQTNKNDEMENIQTSERLKVVINELSVQNKEIEKRTIELDNLNKELILQHQEKDKCTEDLLLANKELIFQNEVKDKCAEELALAIKELVVQNKDKAKRVEELEEILFIISHKERQHISRILGLSDLIEKGKNTPEELSKEVAYIKESALALNEITKEMTKYIENLLPPAADDSERKS